MRLLPYFAAGLLGTAGLIACVNAGDPDARASANDIVGGIAANGKALDAVGSIMITQPGADAGAPADTFQLCTGTLISPRHVLTSKHCAVAFKTLGTPPQTVSYRQVYIEAPTVTMTFQLGPDSANPTRKVGIESVATCNEPDQGGYGEFGCDLAIYHLSEAIADVTPLPYAPRSIGPEVIGQKLSVVGFGTASQDREAGAFLQRTRNTGTATLRMVNGLPMQMNYASLQAAIDAYTAASGAPPDAATQDKLTKRWSTSLIADAEVFAGGVDGDSVNCTGDMGAPLLQNDNGVLTVYGVASVPFGSMGGADLCSSKGALYATLGAAGQKLIANTLNGPCVEESVAGRCEGDVAIRCTKDSEGPQRISKIDCSASLQHCLAPSDTRRDVACGD